MRRVGRFLTALLAAATTTSIAVAVPGAAAGNASLAVPPCDHIFAVGYYPVANNTTMIEKHSA